MITAVSKNWAFTHRVGDRLDWVVYDADNPHLEICQMFHDGTEETPRTDACVVAMSPEMLRALINIKGLIAEKDVIHVQVIEAIIDKVLDKVDENLSAWTNKIDNPAKKDDTFQPMDGIGPANIVALIRDFRVSPERVSNISFNDRLEMIGQQAELTMIYINACNEARRMGKPLPAWHDIIADKGETDG